MFEEFEQGGGYSPTSAELEVQRLRLDNYKLHQESFDKTLAAHLASVTFFAIAAIRGVFFLNGAAAVAVFAAKEIPFEIKVEILNSGAWGTVFAVVCAALSYLSQKAYMAEDLRFCAEKWSKAFGQEAPKREWYKSAHAGAILSFIAILFFCGSLGMFIYGVTLLPKLFHQ